MGFTNVILLNADRWRSDEGSVDVSSAAAAGDIHYCFGMKVFPRDPSHAWNVHLHVQCSGRGSSPNSCVLSTSPFCVLTVQLASPARATQWTVSRPRIDRKWRY